MAWTERQLKAAFARRNDSYIGQTFGKYKVIGRSEKTWSKKHGFIILDTTTGQQKEVSRSYVYIIKRRTQNPNYLGANKNNKKETNIIENRTEQAPNNDTNTSNN